MDPGREEGGDRDRDRSIAGGEGDEGGECGDGKEGDRDQGKGRR